MFNSFISYFISRHHLAKKYFHGLFFLLFLLSSWFPPHAGSSAKGKTINLTSELRVSKKIVWLGESQHVISLSRGQVSCRS